MKRFPLGVGKRGEPSRRARCKERGDRRGWEGVGPSKGEGTAWPSAWGVARRPGCERKGVWWRARRRGSQREGGASCRAGRSQGVACQRRGGKKGGRVSVGEEESVGLPRQKKGSPSETRAPSEGGRQRGPSVSAEREFFRSREGKRAVSVRGIDRRRKRFSVGGSPAVFRKEAVRVWVGARRGRVV